MLYLCESCGWAHFVFAGSLLALFYIYAGYLLLLLILGLFFRRPETATGHMPPISVLIAAYNEEASIAEKLKNTFALDYPRDRLQIIVASDGSTDRTDEIVQSFAAADSRLQLVRVTDRLGKTNVQNKGLEHCTGEIIVFSDATSIYHKDVLRYLVSHYADPNVGAVSGRYQYFDHTQSPSASGSIVFWNYENIIKALQHRIDTLTGCSGCIYSVRKSLYVPLPVEACSDIVEPLKIVEKGYRVAFESRALAFEETTTNARDEFKMRVRVATRGMRAVLEMSSLLKFWQYGWVSFQLFSHKVLRWLAPLFMFALLVSSAVLAESIPWIRGFFFLQIAFYAFAALSLVVPVHNHWKPFGIPLYFCTLNAAALMGLVEIIRGQKHTAWETVRSNSAP